MKLIFVLELMLINIFSQKLMKRNFGVLQIDMQPY